MSSVLARGAVAALVAAALAAGTAAAAEPTPTPPGLEQIPSADRESVTRLLAKMRKRYGADAVALNTNLLLHAMRSGSLLASGVRIAGFETARDKRWLEFDVETGLVFDDNTRDELARLHVVWGTIVAPSLRSLKQCEMDADGVLIKTQYYHRPYSTVRALRADLSDPGTTEEASFFVPKHDIVSLIHDGISSGDLLTRAHVAVDGRHRSVTAPAPDGPTTPGPE